MAEGDPPQTPDLAVRAFIGVFVLGAVLHGFDVMKDGMQSAATWWSIGGCLALFDWYWVRIKNWLGPQFATSANNVATDFRWWTLAIVVVFGFVAGNDIYRAATGVRNISPPVSTVPAHIDDARATELQKSALIEWLQQAQRERDNARQELNQLQKQMQDARLRAPSMTFPLHSPVADNAAQECVNLAHRLADLNPKGASDKAEIDHIRSTMTALGCGCDASKK